MKLRAIARSANERLRKSLAIIGHTFTINDVFIVLGLAAASRGLSMISEPLAWIFAGTFFLLYGLWGVYVRTRG